MKTARKADLTGRIREGPDLLSKGNPEIYGKGKPEIQKQNLPKAEKDICKKKSVKNRTAICKKRKGNGFMEEIFAMIEEKITASGYPEAVDGEQIYNEISDEIEEKENGSYVFMVKRSEDTFFEYHLDILEDSFNLSTLDIRTGDASYHIDFDA